MLRFKSLEGPGFEVLGGAGGEVEGVLGVEDGVAVRVDGFAGFEELEAGLAVVVGGGGRRRVVVSGADGFDLEMGGRGRGRGGGGTFEDGAEKLAARG